MTLAQPATGSTYGDERSLGPLVVAGNALRAGVEHRFAIDQEAVMVVPMIQLDLNEPSAVRLALHGMGRQIPIIEIAGEMDLFGARGHADEVDGLGHFLGGIAVGGEKGAYWMHRTTDFC